MERGSLTRGFFSSVFSFCKTKGYYYWLTLQTTFPDSVFRIRPPDCSKFAKNPKNDNDVTIFWHDLNVKLFWYFLFLLSWLVAGPSFMSISSLFWNYDNFFYKGLTRNPEIGNTPLWVLPNIWRLGRVMDTKFGANVSNRMLLNAAKFQGYSFYRS